MDVIAVPIALGIVLAEIALMFMGTALLLMSSSIPRWVFEKSNIVGNYIPALYRYSSAFGHTSDFYRYFSIHLFYGALQVFFIGILAVLLLKSVKGKRPEPLGVRNELWFFAVLLMFLSPSIELFWGPYDVAHPSWVEASDFILLFGLSGANFMLFFLVYARFWEGQFDRLLSRRKLRDLDLEPVAGDKLRGHEDLSRNRSPL